SAPARRSPSAAARPAPRPASSRPAAAAPDRRGGRPRARYGRRACSSALLLTGGQQVGEGVRGGAAHQGPGAEPGAGGGPAVADGGQLAGVLFMGVAEVVAVGRADAAGRARGALRPRTVGALQGGAERDRGATGGAAGEAVQLEAGEGVAVVDAERDREGGVPGGVVPADAAPGVVVEVDVGEGEQGGALLDGVRLASQRGVAGDAAAAAGAGDLVPGGVEDAHL